MLLYQGYRSISIYQSGILDIICRGGFKDAGMGCHNMLHIQRNILDAVRDSVSLASFNGRL